MIELRHEVNWTRAYDGTNHPRNYGVHGVEFHFVCIGSQGAVNFTLYTNWHLKHIRDKFERSYKPPAPIGYNIGCHSITPQYEGHTACQCSLTSTGSCFYDSSLVYADEWVEGFLAGGKPWLEEKMEELYNHYFNDGPDPDLTPQYRTFDL